MAADNDADRKVTGDPQQTQPIDFGEPIRRHLDELERDFGETFKLKRHYATGSIKFLPGHTRDLIHNEHEDPSRFQAIKEFGLEKFGVVDYVTHGGRQSAVLEVNMEAVIHSGLLENEQALKEFVHMVGQEIGQDNNLELLRSLEALPPKNFFTQGLTSGRIKLFVHNTEPYYQANAQGADMLIKHPGFLKALDRFPGLQIAHKSLSTKVPLILARTLPPI